MVQTATVLGAVAGVAILVRGWNWWSQPNVMEVVSVDAGPRHALRVYRHGMCRRGGGDGQAGTGTCSQHSSRNSWAGTGACLQHGSGDGRAGTGACLQHDSRNSRAGTVAYLQHSRGDGRAGMGVCLQHGSRDGRAGTGTCVWHSDEDGQVGRKKQRLYLIDERLSGGERKLSLYSTG